MNAYDPKWNEISADATFCCCCDPTKTQLHHIHCIEYYIIAHASQFELETTIKNAIPGYATRDSHMTWPRDGHMIKNTWLVKM